MEKQIKKLAIASYSTDPGPRYTRQGESSGEDYYHNQLNGAFYEAVANKKLLEVSLDGTSGYASSFLDEAFGNLVYDFSLDLVKKNLIIKSDEEPEWIEMLNNQSFKEWEDRRASFDEPRKTAEHSPWYRYKNGEFSQKVWLIPE